MSKELREKARERYAGLEERGRLFKRLLAVSGVSNVVLLVAVVAMAFRPSHVPYVLAVDSWGQPRLVERLDEQVALDDVVIRAELRRFVVHLRTRVRDPEEQRRLSSQAAHFLTQHAAREIERTMVAEAANGRTVAKREVRVRSVLRTDEELRYLIEWDELEHEFSSVTTSSWQAFVRVRQARAVTEENLFHNPLGLRIETFDFTRLTED